MVRQKDPSKVDLRVQKMDIPQVACLDLLLVNEMAVARGDGWVVEMAYKLAAQKASMSGS